jgi:hypothetical protein
VRHRIALLTRLPPHEREVVPLVNGSSGRARSWLDMTSASICRDADEVTAFSLKLVASAHATAVKSW